MPRRPYEVRAQSEVVVIGPQWGASHRVDVNGRRRFFRESGRRPQGTQDWLLRSVRGVGDRAAVRSGQKVSQRLRKGRICGRRPLQPDPIARLRLCRPARESHARGLVRGSWRIPRRPSCCQRNG